MKNLVLIISRDAISTARWKSELAGKVKVYVARSCKIAEKAQSKYFFNALVIDENIIKEKPESEEKALYERIREIAKKVKGPKIAAANTLQYVMALRKVGVTDNANRLLVSETLLRKFKLE